jgi:uncharacterized membrane protein YczE
MSSIMGDILIVLGIVIIANAVPVVVGTILAVVLIYYIVRAWRAER